ncbi:uncharacterized protein LOC144132455 [Amblyomma americanum]
MAWLNFGACLSLLVLATVVPPAKGEREHVDSLRMFSALPHAVTAFTSSNDTAFKCSSIIRTLFDARAKTVTYVMSFKAHSGHRGREVIFDVSFGEKPGQGAFFVNQDTAQSYTGSYEYSDYATCAVIAFPFEGQQLCTLWVKEAVKYNIPKHCLDKYEQACEYRVPQIDRSLCKYDEE